MLVQLITIQQQILTMDHVFYISPTRLSMFAYTCPDTQERAFYNISSNIEIVKDEWGLAYIPAWEFNAFDNLTFGEGYQIKMVEEVNNFKFCDFLSQFHVDAAFAEGVQSVDITIDNQIAFDEGVASVTPEDGITQANLDALVQQYEGYTAPVNLQLGDQHLGGIVLQINED